ncbi:MAG: type I pullulanase [Clostridiaceae bacterium]|nr:type I pullulanase [Clostridiaceae bacterium]
MNKEYYDLVVPYLEKYDYDSKEFQEKYHYTGELGALYHKRRTTFRVWSPVASNIEILFFGRWEAYYQIPDIPLEVWTMKKIEQGVWEHQERGDLHLGIYLYRVTYFDGRTKTCVDPYAKAVTINSGHTVVIDPQSVKLKGESAPRKKFKEAIDSVIYEASIRDLTIYPYTDIERKGKYLGLTETGKVNNEGLAVGLDYIKSLGITHLQLLPFYDFATVDERNPLATYNWGYDPVNYNVPDGSFSINPENPISRIIELKKMIKALHQNDIGVIMDVVYNHVYTVETHPFTILVPGYYFRHYPNHKLANGTFCGNEIASERSMVSRYIVDSVLYWTNEFRLNGFRFDLMGILDINTMNKIRAELDKIDPNIIMIGEGWNMGDILPTEKKAIPENSEKLKGIGFFNDQFRNAVRGDVFHKRSKGYITGQLKDDSFLDYEMLQKRFSRLDQMVQYLEAHDNFTLFDQVSAALPDLDMPEYERRQNLATSMVILLQGIPFIHAGQEFLRTKMGNHNSYNASDKINQLDWSRINRQPVEYLRELIRFRKKHEYLYYKNFEEVLDHLEVTFLSDELIKVRQKNEKYDFWFFFNAYEAKSYTLVDAGEYRVYFADNTSFLDEEKIITFKEGENTVGISGLSTLVMQKI